MNSLENFESHDCMKLIETKEELATLIAEFKQMVQDFLKMVKNEIPANGN